MDAPKERNNTMKSWICCTAVGTLALALAGCGNNSSNHSSSTNAIVLPPFTNGVINPAIERTNARMITNDISTNLLTATNQLAN